MSIFGRKKRQKPAWLSEVDGFSMSDAALNQASSSKKRIKPPVPSIKPTKQEVKIEMADGVVGYCQEIAQMIVNTAFFRSFIIFVIVIAGILVGVETYPSIVEQYGPILHLLDEIIIWIFVVEIVLKMISFGYQPWRYFEDGWNVFDFVIVAVYFLPFSGSFVAVLRLARIFRVFKLVTALPQLQVLVNILIRTLPSMSYLTLLLALHLYIYAVLAVFLYGENDPYHFGSLPISALSLFRIVTLDNWSELVYINMYGCDQFGYTDYPELCTSPVAHPVTAVIFFLSYILTGSMIIINLFIGVILNATTEAHKEMTMATLVQHAHENDVTLSDELKAMEAQLSGMMENLQRLVIELDEAYKLKQELEQQQLEQQRESSRGV